MMCLLRQYKVAQELKNEELFSIHGTMDVAASYYDWKQKHSEMLTIW